MDGINEEYVQVVSDEARVYVDEAAAERFTPQALEALNRIRDRQFDEKLAMRVAGLVRRAGLVHNNGRLHRSSALEAFGLGEGD